VFSLPTMETQRLILRALTPDDDQALSAAISDPEVAANMLNLSYPFSVNDARLFILYESGGIPSGESFPIAVVRKQNNRLMGMALLTVTREHQRANLAYLIGRAYRNQGYITEAVQRAIQFSFEEADINRIGAWCFEHNLASKRVMEKVGMTYEATFRQNTFQNGKFLSMHIYSILRNEWLERQGRAAVTRQATPKTSG
jgi:RimJ/RimL family protein N-acetyltransferase